MLQMNQPNVNQPNVNQPNEKADLRSKSPEMGSQTSDTEEQDWWTVETEPRPKQLKSRIFKGTYSERTEKPKKHGKAHNRRDLNGHANQS